MHGGVLPHRARMPVLRVHCKPGALGRSDQNGGDLVVQMVVRIDKNRLPFPEPVQAKDLCDILHSPISGQQSVAKETGNYVLLIREIVLLLPFLWLKYLARLRVSRSLDSDNWPEEVSKSCGYAPICKRETRKCVLGVLEESLIDLSHMTGVPLPKGPAENRFEHLLLLGRLSQMPPDPALNRSLIKPPFAYGVCKPRGRPQPFLPRLPASSRFLAPPFPAFNPLHEPWVVPFQGQEILQNFSFWGW